MSDQPHCNSEGWCTTGEPTRWSRFPSTADRNTPASHEDTHEDNQGENAFDIQFYRGSTLDSWNFRVVDTTGIQSSSSQTHTPSSPSARWARASAEGLARNLINSGYLTSVRRGSPRTALTRVTMMAAENGSSAIPTFVDEQVRGHQILIRVIVGPDHPVQANYERMTSLIGSEMLTSGGERRRRRSRRRSRASGRSSHSSRN